MTLEAALTLLAYSRQPTSVMLHMIQQLACISQVIKKLNLENHATLVLPRIGVVVSEEHEI